MLINHCDYMQNCESKLLNIDRLYVLLSVSNFFHLQEEIDSIELKRINRGIFIPNMYKLFNDTII